jgi:hypothetical protein
MTEQSTCRFPRPWTVEQIPGGYKVRQSLAYARLPSFLMAQLLDD